MSFDSPFDTTMEFYDSLDEFRDNIKKKKVAELIEMLKERGAHTSGRKDALVDR